jgi:ubiquinone/menaquinone biosynthesis C-methylase UbiE
MIDYLEKKQVGEALKKMSQGSMLEVGCGTGHWSAFFCQNGFKVTGLDISEEMLDRAIHRQLPGCYFTPGNTEQLIFQDHTFDHVAAMAVLEFVDDPDKAFNEIHRVLKPGGYFLIGALNKNSALANTGDDVIKHAQMFTPALLTEKLLNFGEPEIRGCVLLDSAGFPKDFKDPEVSHEELCEKGAFLVGLVKKIH